MKDMAYKWIQVSLLFIVAVGVIYIAWGLDVWNKPPWAPHEKDRKGERVAKELINADYRELYIPPHDSLKTIGDLLDYTACSSETMLKIQLMILDRLDQLQKIAAKREERLIEQEKVLTKK